MDTNPKEQHFKDDYAESGYFNFDENNIHDIKVPLKTIESKVSYLKEATCFLDVNLKEGDDYTIDENTLILKKEFLKFFLNKNSIITINFKNGTKQNILIHNDKEAVSSDPLRNGITQDEVEASFSITPDTKADFKYYNEDSDPNYKVDEDGVLFTIILDLNIKAPIGETALTNTKDSNIKFYKHADYKYDYIFVKNILKPINITKSQGITTADFPNGYLCYNKETLDDYNFICLPDMKNVDNIISFKDNSKLTAPIENVDYFIQNDLIYFTKNYLMNFIDKNAVLIATLRDGSTFNIFINNAKNETPVKDSLTEKSEDKPEIALSITSNTDDSISSNSPAIITIKNTSNMNIDLSKLRICKYHNNISKYVYSEDMPAIIFAAKVNDTNNISSHIKASFYPKGDDLSPYNNYTELSFDDNMPHLLAPDDTLIIVIDFGSKDKLDEASAPIAVKYDNELIYGSILPRYKG